jgi:hypothetical protein
MVSRTFPSHIAVMDERGQVSVVVMEVRQMRILIGRFGSTATFHHGEMAEIHE